VWRGSLPLSGSVLLYCLRTKPPYRILGFGAACILTKTKRLRVLRYDFELDWHGHATGHGVILLWTGFIFGFRSSKGLLPFSFFLSWLLAGFANLLAKCQRPSRAPLLVLSRRR
jgi:hypothetical protein